MSIPHKAERSPLNFHMGEAFCRIAATYPTILDVILEQVQNALDANATAVSIVLNRKTRHIAIRDNGDGVSQTNLTKALQDVCLTQKELGKLGRFGIGLISTLGKCRYSTFTSCPPGVVNGYTEWTFVTREIRKQSKNLTVPLRAIPNQMFITERGKTTPKGMTTVMWRTEVNIFEYSTDKFISRITSIDALAETIFERYGQKMQRDKVVLNLKFINEDGEEEKRENVRAQSFKGRSLGEVTMHEPSVGKVIVRLFLAPKTTKGQDGKVLIGETTNDYRFGFNLFARSAENLLPEEVLSSLQSGIFEGEILGEKVRLDSARKSFEKNDAFVGFCTAIETWYKKHGVKHFEEIKESTRDQRYQDLGVESLRQIEAMLKDPEFADIRKVLDDFKVGSVGKGHTPRQKNTILGEQEEKSVSTQGQTPRSIDSGPASHRDLLEDHPKHQPYTVAGPRGQQRALVKRDSIGLQFSYIAMDGSNRLWELDDRQGILHFNVNHPIWVSCDVTDRKVKQLQETVAIYALTIKAMPEEHKTVLEIAFDEALRPLTFLYHMSRAFNLRKADKFANGKE